MPESHPAEHQDDDQSHDEEVEEEVGDEGIHGVEERRTGGPEGWRKN